MIKGCGKTYHGAKCADGWLCSECENSRIAQLEKEIADLRTSDRVTAPVRCPECKHVFHASVGEKNENCSCGQQIMEQTRKMSCGALCADCYETWREHWSDKVGE